MSIESHLTSRKSIKECAYLVGCERQKICRYLPETTVCKSYAAKHSEKSQYADYSDLPKRPTIAMSVYLLIYK